MRAGLRYTKDKMDFVADRIQAPPFSPPFIGRRSTSTDATNTSFDLSGTYAIDKDVNAYARLATGLRAPSIQGRLLFGDTLSVANSQKVQSGEAAAFVGNRADKIQAIYGIDFNNLTGVVNEPRTFGVSFKASI